MSGSPAMTALPMDDQSASPSDCSPDFVEFLVKWRSQSFLIHVPSLTGTVESAKLALEDRTSVDVASQKLINLKRADKKPVTDDTRVMDLLGAASAVCTLPGSTNEGADADVTATNGNTAADGAASPADTADPAAVAAVGDGKDQSSAVASRPKRPADDLVPFSTDSVSPAAANEAGGSEKKPPAPTPLSRAPLKALLIGTPEAERVTGPTVSGNSAEAMAVTVVNDLDENAPDFVYPESDDPELAAIVEHPRNIAARDRTLSLLRPNAAAAMSAARAVVDTQRALGRAVSWAAASKNLRSGLTVCSLPRNGYPLLVLDLDYTLFDMKTERADFLALRRPFTAECLTLLHRRYDICIWSQSSARSLEMKMKPLGLLGPLISRAEASPSGHDDADEDWHECPLPTVVADRSTMFSIAGSIRGVPRAHQVKALSLLWDAFPEAGWGAHNTVHVDDLARNFAMNPSNGVQISPFKRALSSAGRRDCEMIPLTAYLLSLAHAISPTPLDPASDAAAETVEAWRKYHQARKGHHEWRELGFDRLQSIISLEKHGAPPKCSRALDRIMGILGGVRARSQ